jgi:metal-responsive CopG/Arc/MetJ family transcriptional regulator
MDTTRTTLALPAGLLAEVDEAVRAGKARSRNAFVALALRHELRALEEAAIDAEFAGMASDQAYYRLSLQLADEFAKADWEAFQLGENQE